MRWFSQGRKGVFELRYTFTNQNLPWAKLKGHKTKITMKQLLQNIQNGKTTVEDIPVPTPREGQALVRVSASLVSAGTERMVVEFAEKSYLGKARSRPDLVKQTLDKAKREGIMPTVQAVF